VKAGPDSWIFYGPIRGKSTNAERPDFADPDTLFVQPLALSAKDTDNWSPDITEVHMNPRLFWMATACLITLAGAPTLAFNSYRLQAIKQLKLEPDKADGTMVVGCVLCHTSPDGGAPWNPFGQRLQTNLDGDFAKSLLKVLSELRDSDGDGYTDALELFAKTLPGDAKSVPTLKPEELQKEFEKGGGLEQFKP
jgi:hypothetical protein